eukprot:4921161-Pyramimonas_sp.AAC.1
MARRRAPWRIGNSCAARASSRGNDGERVQSTRRVRMRDKDARALDAHFEVFSNRARPTRV